MEVVGLILPRIFVMLWGFFWLSSYSLVAWWDANVLGRPGKKVWDKIEKARKRMWDSPDMKHEFITLSSGRKIHYISNLESETVQKKHLTVFIHGWPNSCMLWRDYLTAPKLNNDHAMVAFDLPGFGLSDPSPSYGPDEFLNAVSEFILQIISRHTIKDSKNKRKGRMVIVGHDWGAYVTERLATDAPKLADRFIATNFPPPSVISTNIKSREAEGLRLLKSWLTQPTQIQLLVNGFRTLGPPLTQLVKSSYVFIFNLPAPLRNAFGPRGGYWFWRVANYIAMEPRQPGDATSDKFADLMASTMGSTVTPVKFSETIRLYSEGIVSKPWTKSDAVIKLLGTYTASKGYDEPVAGLAKGAINAPISIVWGGQDVAIDMTLSLEGIENHVPKGSNVAVLANVHHWTPLDKDGRQAIENIILWSINGEKDAISRQLKGLSASVTLDK